MDSVTIIGSLAGVLTTIAFLPQIVRIHRTKETRDLSFSMYAILTVGVFLWALYGLILKSVPIVLANTVVFILSLYILSMKIKHG